MGVNSLPISISITIICSVEHSNSGKKKFRFDSILATESIFFLLDLTIW